MGSVADEAESLAQRVDLVCKARHEASKVAFSCVFCGLNAAGLASQAHRPLAVDLGERALLIYVLGYAVVLQSLHQVFTHLHKSEPFSKSPNQTLVAGSMFELGHMAKYFLGQVFVITSDAQFILLRNQRAQLIFQDFLVHRV